MLPPYVNTLVFVVIAAALVGCVGRFDYNLVLALGWLYLGDKHPHFTNTIGFYVMIFGSIVIDGITIILSGSQQDRFTFLFVPLLEIITKFFIAGVALQWQYVRTKGDASLIKDNKNIEQDIYNQ